MVRSPFFISLATAAFVVQSSFGALEAFYCEGDVNLRARGGPSDPITCIGSDNVDINWKQIPADQTCKTDYSFYVSDPSKPVIFRVRNSVHYDLRDGNVVAQLSATKPACNIRPGQNDGKGSIGVDLLNVYFQNHNNTIKAITSPVLLVCDGDKLMYSTRGAGGTNVPSFTYWSAEPRSKCSNRPSRPGGTNATATEFAVVYQCPDEVSSSATEVTSTILSLGGWGWTQENFIAHISITCGQPRVWPHCREISWCSPPLGFPYSGLCAASAPGASTIFNRFCSETDLQPCFVTVEDCTPCGSLGGMLQNRVRVCGRSSLAADATVDAVRGGRMPFIPAYADIRSSDNSGRTWSATSSCSAATSVDCARPPLPHTQDDAAMWQSERMLPSALAFAQRQYESNPSFVSAGVRRKVTFGGGFVDAAASASFASVDCSPQTGSTLARYEARRQCCLDFDRYLVCTLHMANASLCLCGGQRRTCNAPTSCEWSKGNLGDDTVAPPDSLLIADSPEMALMLATSWKLAIGIPPVDKCTVECPLDDASLQWCSGRDIKKGEFMCSRCFSCRASAGRQFGASAQVVVACRSGDMKCIEDAVCRGLLPPGSMCRIDANGLMSECPTVTSCGGGSKKSLFGLLALVLLIPLIVACCVAILCWRSGSGWGGPKSALSIAAPGFVGGTSVRSDTYNPTRYSHHPGSVTSYYAGSIPPGSPGIVHIPAGPLDAASLGPLGLGTVIQYDDDAATRMG